MHRFLYKALDWRGLKPETIPDDPTRFEKAYRRLVMEYDVYLLEINQEYTSHEWVFWLLFGELFMRNVDFVVLFGHDDIAPVSSVKELSELSNELRQSGHQSALIMVTRGN